MRSVKVYACLPEKAVSIAPLNKVLLNNKALELALFWLLEICKMAGMKKIAFLLLFFVAAKWASAQKVDSIYFHLYTDSLKKGFYNYINVDGKTAEGQWIPLTDNEIIFTTNGDTSLHFQHNDLFIDSAYAGETVTVKATLKSNPKVWKEVTIYIRKRGFDQPLKTNEEILEEYSKQPVRKQKNNKQ